ELLGVSYRTITESFMHADTARFPLLAEIRDFFDDFAKQIQAAGPGYVYSQEWLGIYWPADEYIFIKLTAEGRMQQFHDECGALLRSLASQEAPDIGLLDEALRLNPQLVTQACGH